MVVMLQPSQGPEVNAPPPDFNAAAPGRAATP
jgi:hypothetical protein